MIDIKKAIANTEVLKKANPATMARLVNSALLTKRDKDEFLFMDREEVNHIYFLIKGKLALHNTNTNGNKKIMFILESGTVVNEEVLYEKTGALNCELLEDSYLISFCADAFISIMQDDFRLTKAVIDSLALKNRRLYRQLKNTPATTRGDKKIAAKLWKIALDQDKHHSKSNCSNMGKSREAVIPMTITCLAEMIGSRRETVSRQVKSLSEKGLVRHENGNFYIADRDALKKYYSMP